MSLLLKVLGGALAGVGKGMVQQAELDYDRQKQELLAQRETALANLQHQNRTEEIAQTGKENRITAHQEATDRGELAAADDKRQEQLIKLKSNLDLSNEKTLAGIRHKYNLSETQAQQLRQAQIEAAQAHVQVDHYQVKSDGSMVVWKKDGSAYTVGGAGDFVPPSSGGDSLGIPTPTGSVQPTGQAVTQPAGGNSQKAAALAALGNTYHQAAKDPDQFRQKYPSMFDENGKLLPLDTLTQQVNDRYGS